MSGRTNIEWTDRTWNPTRGCSMARGSETGGCKYCYAARTGLRHKGKGKPYEGLVRMTENGPRWTGKIELVESALEDPLHWKTPSRVFVDSMSDLFHEDIPDEYIDRVFAVMALCSQHTFQVLTKRAGRLAPFMDHWRSKRTFDLFLAPEPEYSKRWTGVLNRELDNVWLGVSVENQATADLRIPALLRAAAAVRFVSYEPALGPVEWDADWLYVKCKYCGRHSHPTRPQWEWNGSVGGRCEFLDCAKPYFDESLLNWVITGGESGPDARPFDLAWARNTIAQCREAEVPCFVKQLGARPGYARKDGWRDIGLKDRKGGDMSEWPEDLRVREYPK